VQRRVLVPAGMTRVHCRLLPGPAAHPRSLRAFMRRHSTYLDLPLTDALYRSKGVLAAENPAGQLPSLPSRAVSNRSENLVAGSAARACSSAWVPLASSIQVTSKASGEPAWCVNLAANRVPVCVWWVFWGRGGGGRAGSARKHGALEARQPQQGAPHIMHSAQQLCA
jgi:hypothetical protein